MIKKFIFFPIWKIDKLENKLNEMEKQGYRLDYIKYSYWFYFKKTNPQNSNYIITYDMAKDNRPGMYEYRHQLLSEYSANKILTKYTKFNIFRVTGQNKNFKKLITYRDKYFQHVYFQYFIASFIMFSILFPLIIIVLHNLEIISFELVFIIICFIICFIIMIYNLYGYIKQKQKIIKCEKDNLKKK